MNALVLSLVLPLVGVGAIALLAGMGPTVARQVALVFSLATLAVVASVVLAFPQSNGAIDRAWLDVVGGDVAGGGVDVRFSLALDGLSVWLYALSALLVVTSVLVSWQAIQERAAAFYALLLLLETGMLGVFAARDVLLFYVFFEFTLIPLFFLIGIWGSEERRYAAIKFFLFTLAGSLLTFLGLLAIVFWNYQQSGSGLLAFGFEAIAEGLRKHPLDLVWQRWIFWALFAGFAIKVPLFPLHTWLPLAHVQAPTAGSVILAGVLLKLGTYGFVRFSLAWLPDASAEAVPLILCLAVAGILYGALVALAQTDMKRLIAYSSVSHLGFCMLGLFSLNPLGLHGGTLQMINHGLSTGGLFAVIGMLYERYHTRQIADLSGVARRLPLLALFMLVFTMSSIGLPGLNGFVGEFLVLIGMFQRGWADAPTTWSVLLRSLAVLSVLGVVLGAWYMLRLVQRVFFGPLREPTGHDHLPVADLCWRELAALVPLVVFIVWIGVAPQGFLERMQPTLDPLAAVLNDTFDQVHGVSAEELAARPRVPPDHHTSFARSRTGAPFDAALMIVPAAEGEE